MKKIITQRIKRWLLPINDCADLIKEANKRLDSQEFYEIMQKYRHVSVNEQKVVTNAFENVKKWIIDNYKNN